MATSATQTENSEPLADAPEPRPRRSSRVRLVMVAVFLALCGVGGYLAWSHPTEALGLWKQAIGQGGPPRVHAPVEGPPKAVRPWDGTIELTQLARSAMGLVTNEVKAQTEPIRLELLGTTDYITDTLTKIRPMFKGRVDKVHVTVSQAVKKGDPLLDLYSKDLAEAKSTYEIERIQWIYDRNLLNSRDALLKTKAVSQYLYEETKNNEMKSHREFEVARDRLMLFGLGESEIESIETSAGSQKARMTLRSPTDGFVIERDVVPGNLYDEDDTLLVVAPLDRLWVWGNVFESDLDLVRLGQSWEIRFPFLDHKLAGKVEYISNRVDPNSHAVRIRTSIPNPGRNLKADMLVRSMLEIPPAPGRTVIPRTALVVDDGRYYVFIRDRDKPDIFERRVVGVAQEKDDHVVLDRGLKAGEQVVSVGALILAQIHEDLKGLQTGAPAASNEPGAD